jgi:hydroxybutyrate-dimer hydrolase
VPRGGSPGAAPAITAANVPPIVDNPTADNLIKFANRTLSVPE